MSHGGRAILRHSRAHTDRQLHCHAAIVSKELTGEREKGRILLIPNSLSLLLLLALSDRSAIVKDLLPDLLPPCRRFRRRRVDIHCSPDVGDVPSGQAGEVLRLPFVALRQ